MREHAKNAEIFSHPGVVRADRRPARLHACVGVHAARHAGQIRRYAANDRRALQLLVAAVTGRRADHGAAVDGGP